VVDRAEWLSRRTFAGGAFDPADLARRKREAGVSVSVCLPARNVGATVGAIVKSVREAWTGAIPLVDEIVAIDARSGDGTAAAAGAAGATVVAEDDLLPDLGPCRGKGDALWRSLAAVSGDLVVWLDADVEDLDPAFVPGLLGPLLTDPDVGYVKGFYQRPLGARAGDGGRVTEICARPLLNLFYPELAGLVQPLSGEAAGRRELLEELPFFGGYAVEIGLLLDIARRHGLEPLAQVDLGERRHTHQPTAALGRMAHLITRAVLRRLADDGRAPRDLAQGGTYARPVVRDGGVSLGMVDDPLVERPPIATRPEYRALRASRS
jgi:glucosyl-3-phosphoglycerate synthase